MTPLKSASLILALSAVFLVSRAAHAADVVEKACLLKKNEFAAKWRAELAPEADESRAIASSWEGYLPSLTNMLYDVLQPYRTYLDERTARSALPRLSKELNKELEKNSVARLQGRLAETVGRADNWIKCGAGMQPNTTSESTYGHAESDSGEIRVKFHREDGALVADGPKLVCETTVLGLQLRKAPEEMASVRYERVQTHRANALLDHFVWRSPWILQDEDSIYYPLNGRYAKQGRQRALMHFRLCSKPGRRLPEACVDVRAWDYLAAADSREKVYAMLREALSGEPVEDKDSYVQRKLLAIGCDSSAAVSAVDSSNALARRSSDGGSARTSKAIESDAKEIKTARRAPASTPSVPASAGLAAINSAL